MQRSKRWKIALKSPFYASSFWQNFETYWLKLSTVQGSSFCASHAWNTTRCISVEIGIIAFFDFHRSQVSTNVVKFMKWHTVMDFRFYTGSAICFHPLPSFSHTESIFPLLGIPKDVNNLSLGQLAQKLQYDKVWSAKNASKNIHFTMGSSINDVTPKEEGGGYKKWQFGVIFKA